MITIYPTEHRTELWKALQKKAMEERKSASDLFEVVLEDWLKAHGDGNPEYSLDKYQNAGFNPYPTPWAPIGHPELAPFTENELQDMIKRLESAIQNLNVELRRKRKERYESGLASSGERYSSKTRTTSQPR